MINFNDLGLDSPILDAISDLGFTTPTPIQQEAIPVLLSGDTDCVGLAQTGTGKTAAFGLPLLQLLNPMSKETQALIIAPTRELCMQIHSDLCSYSTYEPYDIVAVYGGADSRAQIRELKKGAQVVCATPGRLIDFIKKGVINLETVERIVLDEADEMLNMGFLDDINFILQQASNKETTWLFSATMPKEIKRISKKYMNDPYEIAVNTVNSTNTNIEHSYFVTTPMQRMKTLERIIDYYPEMYGIIFTRTKKDAKRIADQLLQDGYLSDALHGDLMQDQRDIVMNRFRDGSVKILVATDVAARGIDISGISHVINFELPDDPEVYTHRSGRTGRAGNKGQSLSILQNREIGKIRQIEKICKNKFNRLEIPKGEDIIQRRLHFTTRALTADDQDIPTEVEKYRDQILHQIADIDKEELLLRFISHSMKEDISKYKDAKDLNSEKFADKGRTGDRTSIFINVGTKDGFNESKFKEWIEESTDIAQDLIYRVHLKELIAFFDVETASAKYIVDTLNLQKIKNRKLRVDISDRQNKPRSKSKFKPGKKAFKPKKSKAKYKY